MPGAGETPQFTSEYDGSVPNPTDEYLTEIRASKPLAKHAKTILELVRPHIRLTPRKGKVADNEIGATRLGGEPDLPEGMEWPIGPGFDGDAPMDFLAQINLDAVAGHAVDKRLPRDGVLAFFVAQSYQGGRVIYGAQDELVRCSLPRARSKKRTAKPPKWAGFDIDTTLVLPPPWSQFVCPTTRSKTTWNPRTGKRGKPKTLVELSPEAHTAYGEIYDRWIDEVGWRQTGMLGYDRPMEGVQEADELCLFRLDYTEHGSYDFVEVVSIYFFIEKDALAAKNFDEVQVFCGSTI
jgi:hypothetical protein